MPPLPTEFSAQSRHGVVSADITARRALREIPLQPIRELPPPHQGTMHVLRYVITVFAAFAKGACELGCLDETARWPSDKIDRLVRDFLRELLTRIQKEHEPPDYRAVKLISDAGEILPRIRRNIEQFPEWERYQEELLKLTPSDQNLNKKFLESTSSPHRAKQIVTALIERAEARFMQNVGDFRKEREDRFADVARLNMSALGRAAKREEILMDVLTRQTKERIRIYGKVAEEESSSEMLAKPLLDNFREEIMTGVRFARMSLVDLNERDARAAGEYDHIAFEALRRQLESVIDPKLLSVVNAEMRVLETSPLAPTTERDTQKPQTEGQIIEPPAPIYSKGRVDRVDFTALAQSQTSQEIGHAPELLESMNNDTSDMTRIAIPESIADQLERLRLESRVSIEELAEAVCIDPTNVSRHLSGKSIPRLKNLRAYDREFSKMLKRKVVIYHTQQNAAKRR